MDNELLFVCQTPYWRVVARGGQLVDSVVAIEWSAYQRRFDLDECSSALHYYAPWLYSVASMFIAESRIAVIVSGIFHRMNPKPCL